MTMRQFKEAINLYREYIDLKNAIVQEKESIPKDEHFRLTYTMVFLEKEEIEAIIKVQEGKLEKMKQRLIELGIEFEEKENEE